MMYNRALVKQHFSNAAPDYDVHARVQRKVLETLVSRAQVNGRVLDIGCGTGLLNELLPGSDITGLDIAHGMSRHTRANFGIDCITADACALPLADASFETVIASLVLQWINPSTQVFDEIARVLSAGGAAAVATFGGQTLQELDEAFRTIDDAPHVSSFEPLDMLRANAASAGLEVESVETATLRYHYRDLTQLLRELKGIGAANKHIARRKGLMTPGQLAVAERVYTQRHGATEGLPATWEIHYLQLRKPA